MKCPHCQKEIDSRREFCLFCGQRVEVTFSELAKGYRKEKAGFKGRELEYQLRWMILALGAAAVILIALNDLWDKRLLFDGSDVPSIEAPPVSAGDSSPILGPQRYLRPLPDLEETKPKVFRYRMPPLQEQLRDLNGGNTETFAMLKLGLGYLQRMQKRDGSWNVSTKDLHIKEERDESHNFKWAKVGITGLALAAFLGQGSRWEHDETTKTLPYRNTIKKALSFLIRSQDVVNGRFGPPEGNFMYNHALATLAISEAAGISADPILFEAARRGVGLIERIQGNRGGWGYRDQIAAREDSSVSAWQVQALLAAREAGIKVDEAKLKKALKFYQDATDPVTGVVAYDFKDKITRPALYGVALMLRQQLGEEPDSREIKVLTKNLMQLKPFAEKGWGRAWNAGKEGISHSRRARVFDPYRWYFGTYGMFFKGGNAWTEWNQALIKSLKEMQSGDGAWRGNDIWSVKMGAVYSTSMCVMSLQVYYRIQ